MSKAATLIFISHRFYFKNQFWKPLVMIADIYFHLFLFSLYLWPQTWKVVSPCMFFSLIYLYFKPFLEAYHFVVQNHLFCLCVPFICFVNTAILQAASKIPPFVRWSFLSSNSFWWQDLTFFKPLTLAPPFCLKTENHSKSWFLSNSFPFSRLLPLFW